MMTKVKYINLGLIDYKEAWDYQEKLFADNIQRKIDKRNNVPTEETENYLIFCQHPHVYTLGKSGDANHLLLNDEFLKQIDATYYKINRGGDITYHGPGQLIMYPIFDLDYFFTDIHKYMRFLEEAVIQTLAHYGIESERSTGFTGVWLDTDKPTARKICAMGVRSSRWVTMHGIGFNINSNLDYFNHIVPCGITDKGVTSLAKELGRNVEIDEVIGVLKDKMATLFNFELIY